MLFVGRHGSSRLVSTCRSFVISGMSRKVPFTLCASERASPGTNAARSASIVSLKPTSSATGVCTRYGRRERLVDPLHHFERTRKSTHDPHIVRHFVDEEALAVSVRVADDDLGGTRLADAVDGGIHLAGHPLARALVFEAVRPQLRRLD